MTTDRLHAALLHRPASRRGSGNDLDRLKDDTITVREQKTGKLLAVPCHPDLTAHLENARRDAAVIVSYRGRAVPYLRFNERFRRIAQRAGIDAQVRDLRRTAMVRLAEAGAPDPAIASALGHSIDATRRIL